MVCSTALSLQGSLTNVEALLKTVSPISHQHKSKKNTTMQTEMNSAEQVIHWEIA